MGSEETPDEGAEDELAMCFTVIGRSDGLVHLVSEGGGEVFAHPAIRDEVWAAALEEVPPSWRIVDVPAPVHREVRPDHDVAGPPTSGGFARMQYELFSSFVEAGFERSEAMQLLLGLVASFEPDDDHGEAD